MQDKLRNKAREWRPLRSFLAQDDELFDLAGRACQLVRWGIEHRFCGQCGSPMTSDDGEHTRFCQACNHHFYPKISPCIIVVVTKGDYCLLARNAKWKRDYYSAVAGFIEPGERAEDCLHREVREEVGIEVENLQYFSSQPWPFPGQLMLGFHARHLSGEIVVDQQEIIEADWYHYQHLPPCPDTNTLSGRLIQHFVSQRHALN